MSAPLLATGPVLEVRGLAKRFGATRALDDVALELGAGEILVVLGPTGAGKTTLLRTLAGLETPDAGTIRLQGRDVTNAPPRARDVALVFQNFSLYPGWTVRANLEFPLRAPGRGLSEAEIERRVRRAAEQLAITPLLERDSRRLSGGEMQRVAIGRAIVREPALFLMDEPLSNLDAKLRESLRVELAALVRARGVPMVYVTHDQAEALSMADRVAVLSGGRVLQTGSPREIYLRPSSPAVARALGSPPMNELEAIRRDGQWVAASDGVPLCAASSSGGASSGSSGAERVLLGVRAEHLSPEGGPGTAVVEVVEDAGPHRVVVARFAGARVHLFAPRSFAVRPGETIHPRISAEHVVEWSRP